MNDQGLINLKPRRKKETQEETQEEILLKVDIAENLLKSRIDDGFCMNIHYEYKAPGSSYCRLAIVVKDATRFKNECLTQLRLHAKHTIEYEAIMFILRYSTLGKYGDYDIIYDF